MAQEDGGRGPSPSALPATTGAARRSPEDPWPALRRGRGGRVRGPDALAGEAVHRRESWPVVVAGSGAMDPPLANEF